MSATAEVQSGLEGVVAFATEIAEPDREGGALRYRGVDIEELVGTVPFEQVWGLLVDGTLLPGLPPAEPNALSVRSGDPRVDVQSALAMLGPQWGFGQLIDISDEEARDNLARASVMALSFVAQSARGIGQAAGLPARDRQGHLDPRALPHPLARRGRPPPRQGDRRLLELRGRARHERVHVHRPRRRLHRRRRRRGAVGGRRRALRAAARRRARPACSRCSTTSPRSGDADRYVKEVLDRGERLMGFGHRVYRAEDPRARVLRRTAHEINAPRVEVAEALEKAALAELKARRPDRVLATNVEFWSAVVLDFAEVPPELFTPMFTCARTAGWSAHIMEQKREGRLIRPTAKYVGHGPPPAVGSEAGAEPAQPRYGPSTYCGQHPGGAEHRAQRAQRRPHELDPAARDPRVVAVVERRQRPRRRAGGGRRRRRARPGRGGRGRPRRRSPSRWCRRRPRPTSRRAR